MGGGGYNCCDAPRVTSAGPNRVANDVSGAVAFWMRLSVTRILADYYSSSNCDIQLKAPQRALISGCRVDKQPILELGALRFIRRRLV